MPSWPALRGKVVAFRRREGAPCSSRSSKSEILIEDNGIGFDEKHAARMFKPFQRLVAKSEYDGSGIGLATAKKIIDRHNGTIEAHSKEGEGATFIVTLPRRKDEAAVDTEGDPLSNLRRLLIIDDDEVDRDMIKRTIEKSDIHLTVTEAASGPEGVSLFQEDSSGCVLLDYQLPGMDGPQILKELQKIRASTPVIGVSGKAGDAWSKEMISLGASGCLRKDDLMKPGALKRVLRSALSKR